MAETLSVGHMGGLRVNKATQQPKQINMLVYGDSGMGKTRLAGSADAVAAMRKVLFIDVEGGTLTLNKFYPNVDVVRVKSWLEVQAVYNDLFAGGHGYETVVIDSLSEAQKFNMDGIMTDVEELDASRVGDIPQLREWGKSSAQMRKFIRAFRDLPINTIMTALLKAEKDPRTGRQIKYPELPGKLAKQLPAFFDLVAHLYVVEKEVEGDTLQQRVLVCNATGDVTAKDRSGNLPLFLINATMQDIHTLITGASA